jgi:ADP-ribose pyrophosphatase YjhB (NUDIX family)
MSAPNSEKCPHCGKAIARRKKPSLTVDIIIELPKPDGQTGIILIKRKNYPLGWAIPGGFVDYGESLETAAVREAKEETSLEVKLRGLLGVY